MARDDDRAALLLNEFLEPFLEHHTCQRVEAVECLIEKQILRCHRKSQRYEYLASHTLGKALDGLILGEPEVRRDLLESLPVYFRIEILI